MKKSNKEIIKLFVEISLMVLPFIAFFIALLLNCSSSILLAIVPGSPMVFFFIIVIIKIGSAAKKAIRTQETDFE